MPAASCPRCCRANSPKNTVWATPSPCGVDTPNTPHSSCGESSLVLRRTGSSCTCGHLRAVDRPERRGDPWPDRIRAAHEGQPGETFIGVDVACRRGRPHLGIEHRRVPVAAVAGVDQGTANDLLVEALRLNTLRKSFIVGG